MTKTIEEQIAEAHEDIAWLKRVCAGWMSCPVSRRAVARAASRLATLEAVRDGRMVAVWATVSATADGMWIAYGDDGAEPTSDRIMCETRHDDADEITILRGYAHVPSTQVHEVEADSEVPS